MSLLSTAARLNTANQLNIWNTSCKEAMNTAKSTFTAIYSQKVSMEGNPEYTTEDIAEVDAILIELNTLAKSLIAPDNTPIV